MRLLTVAYKSSAEFLSHYSESHGDGGALFFRTKTAVEDQEKVLVEISFPGLPNRALVRGKALGTKEGKGVWLAIDPADNSTRDFLLGLARGELEVTDKRERSFERFPTDVPVQVAIDENGSVTSRTHDLGAGGAFIASEDTPPIGAKLKLTIGPEGTPREETFVVEGTVAWVSGGGEGEPAGFGVRFDPRGEGGKRLRQLLRRASESARAPLGGG